MEYVSEKKGKKESASMQDRPTYKAQKWISAFEYIILATTESGLWITTVLHVVLKVLPT